MAINLDRPMVPIQYITSDGRNDRLETPVMNFMKQSIMMLRTIKRVDALLARNTSKDLLDLLSWYAEEAIWGIAAKRLSAAPKNRVLRKITELTGMIAAMARRAGYNMAYPIQNVWMAWNGNVSSQNPFELLMRTILARNNVATLASAQTNLLTYLNGYGTNRPYRIFSESGTPSVAFFCRGHADAANWVVTSSIMKWGVADDLNQWCVAMRYTRLVPGPPNYTARLKLLTARVRRDQATLRTAFHNSATAAVNAVAPDGCDGRLATSWATQAANLRIGGDAATVYYNRTADNALSFDLPRGIIRTRCKRCRTVFRYTCPGEPKTFDDGVYNNWHTCAEALALPLCMNNHP